MLCSVVCRDRHRCAESGSMETMHSHVPKELEVLENLKELTATKNHKICQWHSGDVVAYVACQRDLHAVHLPDLK